MGGGGGWKRNKVGVSSSYLVESTEREIIKLRVLLKGVEGLCGRGFRFPKSGANTPMVRRSQKRHCEDAKEEEEGTGGENGDDNIRLARGFRKGVSTGGVMLQKQMLGCCLKGSFNWGRGRMQKSQKES